MDIEAFKELVNDLIDDIDIVVSEKMAWHGNTEEESQQIVVKNRLCELRSAINGTTKEDMR